MHNDAHPAVRAYHRLLVWDIDEQFGTHPAVGGRALNPLIGKRPAW